MRHVLEVRARLDAPTRRAIASILKHGQLPTAASMDDRRFDAEQKAPLEEDPHWYKDAIIYELHVKAFFDGNGYGVGDFPGLD
jgi:pullulanase/glycogen debranching enzyme